MGRKDRNKGSQYQLQRYVNERPKELDAAIKATLPALDSWEIEWVSPLASEDYGEYWDKRFLEVLGLHAHTDALAEFWPSGGPHWDALARLRRDRDGVLLVEAKAYPREIKKDGSRAKDPRSIEKIRGSLNLAREHYHSTKPLDSWYERYYQPANRLAHLYFFEKLEIPAWLVNIYFVDDQSHEPTTREAWTKALATLKSGLGINLGNIPRSADVLLDAIND